MKRYLLFSGDNYYPGGGWNDFKGAFNTVEEAVQHGDKLGYDWYQVVHLTTLEIVYER